MDAITKKVCLEGTDNYRIWETCFMSIERRKLLKTNIPAEQLLRGSQFGFKILKLVMLGYVVGSKQQKK